MGFRCRARSAPPAPPRPRFPRDPRVPPPRPGTPPADWPLCGVSSGWQRGRRITWRSSVQGAEPRAAGPGMDPQIAGAQAPGPAEPLRGPPLASTRGLPPSQGVSAALGLGAATTCSLGWEVAGAAERRRRLGPASGRPANVERRLGAC